MIIRKSPIVKKLSNILSNNLWVKEKITIENRIYFKQKENEDTTHKPLWKILKTKLIGEFIPLSTYIRRE